MSTLFSSDVDPLFDDVDLKRLVSDPLPPGSDGAEAHAQSSLMGEDIAKARPLSPGLLKAWPDAPLAHKKTSHWWIRARAKIQHLPS